MTKKASKQRATEAYKALIDDFVTQAREFGAASHVESDRMFSKAPAHSAAWACTATLSRG